MCAYACVLCLYDRRVLFVWYHHHCKHFFFIYFHHYGKHAVISYFLSFYGYVICYFCYLRYSFNQPSLSRVCILYLYRKRALDMNFYVIIVKRIQTLSLQSVSLYVPGTLYLQYISYIHLHT